MRKGIENKLHIICDDVDLQTLSNIEFYMRQGNLFFSYTPEVISKNEMLVTVPFEDALSLRVTDVKLQFAFKDANGNPRATAIETAHVEDFLKEVGYDPV